jgi:hypothetical protein
LSMILMIAERRWLDDSVLAGRSVQITIFNDLAKTQSVKMTQT